MTLVDLFISSHIKISVNSSEDQAAAFLQIPISVNGSPLYQLFNYYLAFNNNDFVGRINFNKFLIGWKTREKSREDPDRTEKNFLSWMENHDLLDKTIPVSVTVLFSCFFFVFGCVVFLGIIICQETWSCWNNTQVWTLWQ